MCANLHCLKCGELHHSTQHCPYTDQQIKDGVQDLIQCPYCKGTGNEMPWPGDYIECVECGGSGKLKPLAHDLKFIEEREG